MVLPGRVGPLDHKNEVKLYLGYDFFKYFVKNFFVTP